MELQERIIKDSKGQERTIFIEKGTYTNNSENRGKGRVGGHYGSSQGNARSMRGGKKEVSTTTYDAKSIDAAANNVSSKTGTRADAVKEFATKNNLDIMRLAGVIPSKISAQDFSFALMGKEGNSFVKKIKDTLRASAIQGIKRKQATTDSVDGKTMDKEMSIETAQKLYESKGMSYPSTPHNRTMMAKVVDNHLKELRANKP